MNHLDTHTAAAQARVTADTVRTWCRRGVVTATKHAGRWAIDAASLAHRLAIGALKTARRTRPVVFTVETMTAIGGRRWQKNGMDRVYLNDWAEFAGIEIHRYNTGNISYAAIGGRGIANSRAGALLGAVDKVWFDAADGKLHFRHYDAKAYEIRYYDGERTQLDLLALITSGVRTAIAAL
ncbi:hypothetical protein ACWERV_23105 [Streptomyces sp. NPDC004031]